MNIEEEIEKYEKEIKALGLTKGLNLNSKQTAQVIGVSPSTIEKWRKDYNQNRPHSSLRMKTPNEFAKEYGVELTS